MKKILSGILYRMTRSIEFWGLVVLFLFMTVWFCHISLSNFDFITVTRGDFAIHATWENTGMHFDIDRNNIALHRFESLGISSHDAYRVLSEPLPSSVSGRLEGTYNYTSQEISALFEYLSKSYVIPLILMMIFIPVFFGRLFSDGTIRNLISCGHSRGRIYLSCLIVILAMDILMTFLTHAIYALSCLYYKWHPPVYLPTVLPFAAAFLILLIMASSVSLAVLFISGKKTASFITGFILMTAFYFMPVGSIPVNYAAYKFRPTADFRSEYVEYREIAQENGVYCFDEKFDLLTVNTRTYYEGRELGSHSECTLRPAAQNILRAVVYLDPTLIKDVAGMNVSAYMISRDGVCAVNIAANTFWTLLSSATGILIFKKKEIR